MYSTTTNVLGRRNRKSNLMPGGGVGIKYNDAGKTTVLNKSLSMYLFFRTP